MGSELLQSWNTCHGAFYQVKDSDLQWNMSEQALVSYSLADVSGVPVLLAEATPEGIKVKFEAADGTLSEQTYDLVLQAVGRTPNGKKIDADKAGTVTKILVENGQPVEFGQPLFIIE